MNNLTGRIVKNISNEYEVLSSDNNRFLVKPRGIFRKDSLIPKVGDIVQFNETTILKIEKRKNDFIRPFISNVDYVILVTSAKRPDISFELLDRFLINIEHQDTEAIIVVSKCDLLSEIEEKELKNSLSYYSKYYNVFYSRYDGLDDKEGFYKLLNNKISVVSGQTGAGKSHLLNTLDPNLTLKTDDISIALGRGKHTTRHTELLSVSGLLIADTPGFSSLEISEIKSTDLKEYYKEFVEVLNECKYNQCTHTHEPECKVKELVKDELILKSRYDSYLKFFAELKELEKTAYKREKKQ